MTFSKRLFDLFLASIGFVIFMPLLIGISLWIYLASGGPVFYRSERMRGPDQPFILWKFRTMSADPQDFGVSGGDKTGRITREGRVLRRFRLDELPQLWNILRGDMSFVGPRPPLRIYVEKFPNLYAQVLLNRPGVTGLATLVFHRHEERILAGCISKEETDWAYSRRCVPAKARIDLIYQRHQSICFDLLIVMQTFRRVFN